MEISKEMVRLCHELSYEDLPGDVVDRVKYFILDYLGVAIRGSRSESSLPVHRMLEGLGLTREGVPIIGTRMFSTPPFAALANGAAAHSLEIDDVINSASLHPGVVIITAVLAAAPAEADGRDVIAAVVAGYEVMVKLGAALDPAAHYARGFHPTATCGALGAAVAVSKILKSSREAMQNALGIAGSQAAGSLEFLAGGAFTKRFHAGWSAHSGIVAALLGREGFTGPDTIIEGRFGFLHAFSDKSDPAKVLADWGKPWEVMNTAIKPHSCCRYKQGPIDCILKIVKENNITPEEVEKVTATVLTAGAALVSDPIEYKRRPKTTVDAQFSMPFGAAVAILYGQAALDEYTLENVRSPRVRDLMDRVECVHDPELEKDFPRIWPATVTIDTKDGRSFSTRVDYPKGDPDNPLSWEELIEKFKILTRPVFPDDKLDALVDLVRGLDEMDNLNELMEKLSDR